MKTGGPWRGGGLPWGQGWEPVMGTRPLSPSSLLQDKLSLCQQV